jgi:transposase
MAYSTDLREKVLLYVEDNNSPKKASQVFKIGIATIYRWINQKRQKGHLKAKKKETSYRKFSYEELKDYIEKHPDHFLSEMADHFKVTLQAIFYALKKLKITRQKRARSIKKETKI